MSTPTSWIELYTQILGSLKPAIEALKDDDGQPLFKVVYTGRKAAPTDFPCALIYPGPIRIRSATTNMSIYAMSFNIRVVVQLAENGMEDALMRLGEIEKILIADRSFGGLTDKLEVGAIIPDVPLPRVRSRHEAELTAIFERKM